jgi:hypothetical protein
MKHANGAIMIKFTYATMAFALTILFLLSGKVMSADAKPLHLFILSGQSNMAALNPNHTFKPLLQNAVGAESVLVVHNAWGGQPIRRWYKEWKLDGKEDSKRIGDLYDLLMTDVTVALGDRNPTTVTFIWMQGERDSRQKRAEDYAGALKGLIGQLRLDLRRPDMNFIVGRLSDFGSAKPNERPSWNAIREIQVAIADSDPRGAWTDTDDLNGPSDDLHYTRPGYDELGRRFGMKAMELIRFSESNVTQP